MCMLSAMAARHEATFFVAPNGNGKLPAPSAERPDGPFATLQRARDAVRELKALDKREGRRPRDVVVMLRGGRYFLDQTLVLGPEDSGAKGHPVVYTAYPGERPVISGGRRITGWRKEGKLWVADVAQPPEGWYFAQLFVNGERQTRSREPDTDNWRQWPLTTKGLPHNGMHPPEEALDLYYPGDLIKNWDNLHDIEINVLPQFRWMNSVIPLASVNEAEKHAVLAAPAHYNIKKGDPFRVENTLAGIDEPGEWCLNTREGKVYYLAPEGVDMTIAEVIAPALVELVRVQGDEETEKLVHHLVFRGLTFTEANRSQWDKRPEQTHWPSWRPLDTEESAVVFEGVNDCAVENCRFASVGGYALRFSLTALDNRIVGNEVVDAGGGGILLRGYHPGTMDVNKRNLISRNHIHHIGREYWASWGIKLYQSGENVVSHNYVHHASYIGMGFCGIGVDQFNMWKGQPGHGIRWDEIPEDDPLTRASVKRYLHSHNNVFSYNVIHDHMALQLVDGAGIYACAPGVGNKVLNNVIFNATGPSQWGLGLDFEADDITLVGNVVFNCTYPGIPDAERVGTTWKNNLTYPMGEEPAEIVRMAEIMTNIAAETTGPPQ